MTSLVGRGGSYFESSILENVQKKKTIKIVFYHLPNHVYRHLSLLLDVSACTLSLQSASATCRTLNLGTEGLRYRMTKLISFADFRYIALELLLSKDITGITKCSVV
jgi:hypothetical protein